MRILVSACLLGYNCKYNGKNNLNKKIVEFLKQNGGKVNKGGSRGSKVGYVKCVQGTLCYYVATQCYNKSLGESTLDSIFAICAILENAGICKNKYG